MVLHSSETVLVAVTSMKSLDVVSEYAIRLANGTGKRKLLFILVVHEESASASNRKLEQQKLSDIQKAGKEADIEVQFKTVQGKFSDQVAECLNSLDCPLLVVGEGDDQARRLKELKEIETILFNNPAWHHRNSHHFLMVSERRKDSMLVKFNQHNRNKQGGE